MKSNIEKVYSKLPKVELAEVELATQKVELGLVDDYNERIDKANNFRSKASMAYTKAQQEMKAASIQMDLALKEAQKIEDAAKDIGVKSPIDIGSVSSKAKDYRKVVDFLDKGKISRT
tara:strand:+ start:48 stop:401 length:354 start_codon:yes stop_codon:yes gene_type:complete